MSSGGISPGLDFYAVIRISGTLNQQGIHDLMLDIENLMNSRTVNGKILTKARFTEKGADPQLTVSYGQTEP